MRPGTLLRWHILKKDIATEITAGSVILDIGSFDGSISYHLSRLISGLDITTVDVEESGLRLASEKGLKTVNASVQQLPFANNSIDAVLCLDLIEHVQDDNEAVSEMSRVLKNQGVLILSTPKEKGVSFPGMSEQQIADLNKTWGHVRLGYSLEQLDAMLRRYDLIIEKKSGYFNLLTRFAYRLGYLSGRAKSWKDVIYWVAVRLEPYLKYKTEEHIVIARKHT